MKQKRRLLLLMLICLPAIVVSGILKILFDATILDLLPTFSDAVYYWHMAGTFAKVGFNGGYYTLNEYPASATFTHYYAWGPMYPLLYGGIAKLVGWENYTLVIINLFFLSGAFLYFVYLTNLSNKKIVILGIFLATYPPILTFLPSIMSEGLHLTFAILLAGLFYQLIFFKTNRNKLKLVLFTTIVIAALFKYTWSILLIPFFVLSIEKYSHVKLIVYLFFSIVLMLLIFLLGTYWAAPYPNFLFSLKSSSQLGFQDIFLKILNRGILQLTLVNQGHPLEILQRWLLLFVSFVVIALMGRSFFDFLCGKLISNQVNIQFLLLHFCNLIIPTILVLGLYDFYNLRDYRFLAPHIILSILVLFAYYKQTWLLQWLIVFSLISLPLTLNFYTHNFIASSAQKYQITKLRTTLSEILLYDDRKDISPWCNTVLLVHPINNPIPNEITAIPLGIGVSFYMQADIMSLRFPLKSKYILTQSSSFPFLDKLQTKLLGEFPPLGQLYLNLDSKCE